MAAMAELATTGHVAVDINATASAGAKSCYNHVAIHVGSRADEPRPPAGADADADECAVCMEPLEFVAIGPCGHSSVCSKCALRIRINKKRECCICRDPSPVVVVTRAGGATGTKKKKPAAVHAKLPALGGYQGRVGAYWYHAASAAYFDDQRQYEAACSAAAAGSHESKDNGGGQAAARPAWCNGNVALAVFCLAATAAVMLVMIFA